MDCVQVACPSGQFLCPAQCDADAYCLQGDSVPEEAQQQQQPGSPLLEQLQAHNHQARQLLTLLSIHREQGIAAYEASLNRLFADALACIAHALQTAAAAKQPLLTASSQHSSCFCQLLERLHLLDALWKASNPGPTPGVQQQQQEEHDEQEQEQQQQLPTDGEIQPEEFPQKGPQEPQRCAAPFINQLEARLRGVPGLDAVLAALMSHAQQNAAGGSKQLAAGALAAPAASSSKHEAVEVSCLSAVQEQHSSARALPLLIRLYFNSGSRAETIAAGRPEPLTAKLLERSLAVLAAKPVVPGCADVPVCLTSGLQSCAGLSELAATRKLKLPTELGKLDFKAAFKLDQSYSLGGKVAPLLAQHDELCDLLSQLALELQQAVAVERDIDPKALDNAEQLVAGSINFVSAARASLLDLDAWRLSTCGAGTDPTTPTSARTEQGMDAFQAAGSDSDGTCDRYKLKDDDVVPFINVLGAVKGLTGLLADSSSWLQPLLHEHAVKQLNDFAFYTLPALSKVYARNPRLQDLLRAIYACMQGQVVEVGEDVDSATTAAAATGGTVSSSSLPADVVGGLHGSQPCAGESATRWQQQQYQMGGASGRPLAEGFEGLKGRWGSLKGSTQRKKAQQAARDGAADAAATEEITAAAAAAAAAAASSSAAPVALGGEEVVSQDRQAEAQPEGDAEALVSAASEAAADGAAARGGAGEEEPAVSGDMYDRISKEVAAAAAADVEAAIAAAAAAAAAMGSGASSPCSVSHVEFSTVERQQLELAFEQQEAEAAPPVDNRAPSREGEAAAATAAVAVEDAKPPSAPAVAGEAPADESAGVLNQPKEAAGAAPAAASEPSRKRTLKGLFKFKNSGSRKNSKDKAAAVSAAPVSAPPSAVGTEQQAADGLLAASGVVAVEAVVVQEAAPATLQQQSEPVTPGEGRELADDSQQLEQQQPLNSAKAKQTPCADFAWTDSETNLPLCHLRAAAAANNQDKDSSSTTNAVPSAFNSCADLNSAGFERPPDLPWELQAGLGLSSGIDDSPSSVARAAAMFERMAALHRQQAAADRRLSSAAGRLTVAHANGSRSSPGGWDGASGQQQQQQGGGSGGFAARLSEVAGSSPLSKEQLREVAARDAEQQQQYNRAAVCGSEAPAAAAHVVGADGPYAASASAKEQRLSSSNPASPSKAASSKRRGPGLFGFKSLLHRTPAAAAQAQQPEDNICSEHVVAVAAALADDDEREQQFAALQQLEKEQHLQDKQAAALLAGQEFGGEAMVDDSMPACSAEDPPIPASWGAAAPASPSKQDGGKQRMQSMLSMLRRGNARSAAAGAAAALHQAEGATLSSAAVAAEAEVQPHVVAAGGVASYGAAAVNDDEDDEGNNIATAAGLDPELVVVGGGGGASQCGSQGPDASEDFDEDQPAKTRRVMGLMNRIRVFTQGTNSAKEQQQPGGVAAAQAQQAGAADAAAAGGGGGRAGGSQGLKGLKFAAKLRKAMEDRRQSRFADAVGVDGQAQLPLEAMPSPACLQMLRVLLELLLQEIKAETKKHLMMQLQMAAAAAAGSAGVSKPDASIARPLKQVKAMIKAVHRMQQMWDFPKQLLAAADLSDLWVGASCGSSLAAMADAAAAAAAEQQQRQQQQQQEEQCLVSPAGEDGVTPPKLSASVDPNPPSPKSQLQPWSLYNLLFEDNSEGSLYESLVRNSMSMSASRGPQQQQQQQQQRQPGANEQEGSAADAAAEACDADGVCSDSAAAAAAAAVVPYLSSFPSALIAGCMQRLERMPAELPLLALQVFWDARRLLKSCGLLNQQGLLLLQQQEKLCMCCYMHHLVPTAYEHFKRIAGHQTITAELLHSCKAAPLQPVKQLYLDSLLREPCMLVMQADYSAVAAEAASMLQQQPGPLDAADAKLAGTLQELSDLDTELRQHKAVDQLQAAVQHLQQAELAAAEAQQLAGGMVALGPVFGGPHHPGGSSCYQEEERPVSDQLEGEDGGVRFSGVFTAAAAAAKGASSPTKAASAAAALTGGHLPPVATTGAGRERLSPAGNAAASGRANSRKKRQGRAAKQRSSAAAGGSLPATAAASNRQASPAAAGGAGACGAQPAGVSPLIGKLEAMGAAREVQAAAERCAARRCLQAWGACELDVRRWLLAGMLEALQQDAAVVVARCSAARPTCIVEAQLHTAILQRTHLLLSQYAPLPLSWAQVWQQADTVPAQQQQQQPSQQEDASISGSSVTASSLVCGLLQVLDTAVYDGEAQVLLPSLMHDATAAASAAVVGVGVDGVLAEVAAAVRPLASFLGRQHLAALHVFAGPAGLQQLIAGVVDKLEQEQNLLLAELLSLQQQLPPSLLQLPPAEQCSSAGAVLQFYQQQLSNALDDHRACAAALGGLQRIGNCLALLYLLSAQQATEATPTFMQVAPLLGVVGRPMTDAAAAAECFEGEDLPAPPSALVSGAAATSGCHNLAQACTPGLLMPQVETLVPSDHARHTYEMQTLKELHQEDICRWEARQAGMPCANNTLLRPGGDLARHRVWQASHFQRLLLGPDAEKVRGPAMLLTQTAELRAWRATEGVDVLGPCLQRLQDWAMQLQRALQGGRREGGSRRRSKGTARRAHAATAAARGTRDEGGCGSSRRPAAEQDGGAAKHSSRRRHRSRPQQQQRRENHQQQEECQQSLQQQQQQPGTEEQQEQPPLEQQHQELTVEALARAGPEQRIAAAVAAVSGASSTVAAARAAVRALSVSVSAEQSVSSFGRQSFDPTTDGELSEVEHQLQTLQAQVNAALIAAEERLRVVAISPPQALLTEARPRLQLPPRPIPFSLQLQGIGGGSSASAGVGAADTADGAAAGVDDDTAGHPHQAHPAAALEAQDSVQQASPRQGAFSRDGSSGPASSNSASAAAAAVPAFLNEADLHAAADAAAAAAGLPWADSEQRSGAAGTEASEASTVYAAAVSHATSEQGTTASQLLDEGGCIRRGSRPSSGRAAGLAELVLGLPDEDDGSRSSSSRPSSQGSQGGAAGGSDSQAPCSPTNSEKAERDGDAASAGDDTAAPPHLPGHSRHSPQPILHNRSSRMTFEEEASYLMSLVAAGNRGDRWATGEGLEDGDGTADGSGYSHSQQGGSGSPQQRYPTPPITELLYETTCDELVRVKDERDMLKSEVEVLRNQLKNRDSTLAMLSGQMLITPRTSAADCESLMRAAMSDCSVGSLAVRSQHAVSGAPSIPSNPISLGSLQHHNSTNGGMAGAASATTQRRAASTTPASREPSSEAAAAVMKTPRLGGAVDVASVQQQQQQQQEDGEEPRRRRGRRSRSRSRSKSAAAAAGGVQVTDDTSSAPVSAEASDEMRLDHSSKSSMRAQQTTPCDVSTCQGGSSAAGGRQTRDSGDGSETETEGGSSSDSSSIHDGSSSSCSEDEGDVYVDDEEHVEEACLISTAGSGASRKLKLPQTVKAAAAARNRHHNSSSDGSSSSSSSGSSPWPPAQLAVSLSALKFVLLLDVAMGGDHAVIAGSTAHIRQGVHHHQRGNPDELLSGAQVPPTSPLKRLKRAVEGVAAEAAAVAAGVMNPSLAAADAVTAAAVQQEAAAAATQGHQGATSNRGSGGLTTVKYGDGPLLASAVLLQLSGQSRRFDVLDASGRIAYWVEYDAVKASSSGGGAADGAGAAGGEDGGAAAAGMVSPRGGAGAASMAPSGVAAIVGAPGGIGAVAAEGIAPPKPRSKKRQEEEAEAIARERAAAAAEQALLERLAAAHRQAARISRDGSSLAARFAPAAPARSQKVRLRVFRVVDEAGMQQLRAGTGGGSCSSPGRITFGGGMAGGSLVSAAAGGGAGAAGGGSGGSHGHHSSSGGSAENPKVPAVPVKAVTLQFAPRRQPWSSVRPTQRPIQTHPALPMPRPQPLLLTAAPGGGGGLNRGPAGGGGVAEAGFMPSAVAALPPEAAAAAAAAAAAGTGIVGPSGRLLTGASVAPRAGLVAAARVMAAREVLLQTVPRNAAYSFSVVSDQNRSGRPEDGYSMAPSSADLESLGPESPRRSPHRSMSAAVGASAARLGGRSRTCDGEQWLSGSPAAGGGSMELAGSPSKALSRSPSRRPAPGQQQPQQQQQQGGSSLLSRAFG